ncbi:MAG TPA: copper resistance CopC family protein, partial [Anaerolineaceae bacterium]
MRFFRPTLRWGKRVRALLAAAAVLALLLVPARPVSAHAILTRSIPAADDTLSRAPAQIELFFSEAVEPNFSRITVLDSQGVAVDNADSRVDPAQPAHLTVSLRSLPDGVYTVAWRAISAADGHLTEGSFPFVVGSASATALAAAQRASGSQGQSAFPDALLRGLLYLGFAALTGGTLFSQLAWRPSLRLSGVDGSALGGFEQVYRRTAAAALLLLALTSLVGVFVQAGQASGTGFALPWSSQALSVWLGTRYGLLVIARAALLLILAGLLLPPANRWNRWAALPVLAGFASTLSLQSHAAAQPDPFLPVAADLAHLLAASVWVG